MHESLGQSMREGAKLRGKASSLFYHPLKQTSCAWGAVIERKFGIAELIETTTFASVLSRMYPWVHIVMKCPLCYLEAPIKNLIIHLNDEGLFVPAGAIEEIALKNHNMSREWIADWLDSIDPTRNWIEFENRIKANQVVEVAEEVAVPQEVGA